MIAAALLHDVLEKSRTTAAELRVMTGDPKVVDLVETLIRRAGESDRDYLSRSAANPMTLLVKRLDQLARVVWAHPLCCDYCTK